ncbi:MAG: hypothetical protein ACLVJ6_11730 [Merdibacter sp.]
MEKLLESVHAASVTDHFLAGVYFHAAFETSIRLRMETGAVAAC